MMGDFNFNLLNSENHNPTNNFLNTNLENFLKPLIIKPTRITNHSATLIDNIFTNYMQDNFLSGNIICSISDHLPQFCVLGLEKNLTFDKPIRIKDYSKFDANNFLLEYANISWETEFENQDTNQKMEKFINKLIDRNTPFKKITKRQNDTIKPWITSGILKSIQTKQKLYKKFITCNNRTKKLEKEQKFN